MTKKIDSSEMPFLDHISELRKHLIRIIIAILIGTIIAGIFFDFFESIIRGPLQTNFATYSLLNSLGENIGIGSVFNDLTNIDIHEQKMTEQITSFIIALLIIGLIISLPYVLFEFMRFLLPALTPSEKKYSYSAFFASLFFFLLGVVFSYYFIVPFSVQFLYNFNPFEAEKIWTIGSYISTVTQTILGIGIVFLLPVIVYFLTVIGLLTPNFMKTYRKHAFLVVLIVSAFITPADLMSMFIAAIPLWLLYEFSILVSTVVFKRNLTKNELQNSY